MFRKIAICALIALMVVPAAVLAAGSQGSGNGNGSAQGTDTAGTGVQGMCQYGKNAEHQFQCSGNQTATQKQFMYGSQNTAQSGNQVNGQGNGQMLRTRSCDLAGTQDQDRTRNQTRLRDGSCGNCPTS
ncbi:MAG: hypothetical protein LUQ25_02755 [Methanoregulaceae archaeon]|nr:hypothetical protein [Methanoregulaceae archaeon]